MQVCVDLQSGTNMFHIRNKIANNHSTCSVGYSVGLRVSGVGHGAPGTVEEYHVVGFKGFNIMVCFGVIIRTSCRIFRVLLYKGSCF